jgi:O-acetyl-ADP-ribose deacetylase (regulator of RNase III)
MNQQTKITFVSIDVPHMDAVRQEVSKCKIPGISFDYKSSRIESINDLQYDILISPANSFGELKGGIDMAYYKLLGREKLADRVSKYIRNYADGEIHIGDFGIVPIGEADQTQTYLVLCPTMVVPMTLPADSRNAYYYMRAVLKAIRKLSNTIYSGKNMSVLCPLPCVGVGGMNHKLAAKQMRIGIESMHGQGVIHAINMTKKEEDDNKFKLPHFYAVEKMQNMKLAYIDTTTV